MATRLDVHHDGPVTDLPVMTVVVAVHHPEVEEEPDPTAEAGHHSHQHQEQRNIEHTIAAAKPSIS